MPPTPMTSQPAGINLSTLLQTYAMILFQIYKVKCNNFIQPLYANHPTLAPYFQWFLSLAAFPIAIFILYCGFTLFFITAAALISAAFVQFFAMMLGVTLLFAFLSALGALFTLVHMYKSFVVYVLRQTELHLVSSPTSLEASGSHAFSSTRLRSLAANVLNTQPRSTNDLN